MKNNSNIYDIDGELIHSIDDGRLSVENAEKRLNQYQDKLKQLTDNQEDSFKAGIYRTYIQNLQRYILNYYIMHPEEAQQRLSMEEQIKKAMEELKADAEAEEKPTVMESISDEMDEYVEPIEEITEDETNKEDIRTLHSGSIDLDSGSDKELLESPQQVD